MKDDIASADKINEDHSQEFKARPFNKKIFEHTSSLPQIDKKTATNFEEFVLSKSNTMLAKKTLDEYLQNKENNSANLFRARSFSRKLLEPSSKTPRLEFKKRQLTDFSPFNFKTEERLQMRNSVSNEQESQNQGSNYSRARSMPKYRFFEVKHEIQKKITF